MYKLLPVYLEGFLVNGSLLNRPHISFLHIGLHLRIFFQILINIFLTQYSMPSLLPYQPHYKKRMVLLYLPIRDSEVIIITTTLHNEN